MLSLEAKSVLTKNRSTGFDYLRILLAIAIVALHSILVCYGPSAERPLYTGDMRPLAHFLVPSFFALSGFLVAGSLLRTDHLPTFLMLRVLRIFPALCCEVLISALFIGVALTTLPLMEYLSHPELHRYFLNILGIIQYTLPGVFDTNVINIVNVQLWTIPYELECYIAISVLSILGFRRNPRIFLIVLLCATLILTFLNFEYFVLKEAARPSGRSVTFTFLWGVLFYLLRNEVKHNFYFFCLALVTTWLALRQTQTEYLAAPAIAYVTVYVGLLDIRRTFLLWLGDVSYGVYLYSFAIQQAVYQLLPEYRSWHENFIISIVVSCAVGYLSWHLVELPVLNKKREVIQFTMSLPEKLGLLMRKAMGR